MSLLEELAARLSATADELPLATAALAAERLRVATDLLMWVRQESTNPLAVPELTNATEHLEQAVHALRVSQDAIGEYLAAIGIGYGAPAAEPLPRGEHPEPDSRPRREGEEGEAPSPLGRWWTERVNQLTDHPQEPEDRKDAATSSDELLRRVSAQVRSGDRERLRRELARVEAPVGLGLSALSPLLLRRLATDLLGHQPGPGDLAKLTAQTQAGVRQLLPRMPDDVVSTVLARVCRAEPPRRPDAPTHPTDPAVAGAVLTGLLAQRVGRDPHSLGSGENG